MRFIGFIGPSYTSSSLNVDCQRCLNLYPEIDQLGTGKAGEVASLVSTPGLTLLLALPASPVRGVYQASNGAVYAVGGNKVYSISNAWVSTEIGTIFTTSGPVSMIDNGVQLVIVDGLNGWYVTLANNAFAEITDTNFQNSTLVSFQDGYFIFNKPDSQVCYVSNLYAVTFNALAIGSNSSSPDNLVAAVAINQNLYMFGSQHTESWYDAGTTPMPFARIQGSVVQIGCSSAFSIGVLEGAPYWVGGDANGQGIVYKMNGYVPQRISTPAIESVIRGAGATNIANARAWTYQSSGHLFYCLNVPGLQSTWVYDSSTSLWHERANLTNQGLDRHIVDCSSVAYGVVIGGDFSSGNIYQIDQSSFTDNGTPIVRMRSSPHMTQDLMRMFHSRFQLDMEVGVGLATGQGSAPQAILQWSDDGGHTWSNEHWAGAGRIGETKNRSIWRRLGSTRDRVYRVTITDPIKVVLIGAEIDFEQGAS
ncbi:MAG: packaged DNA stabilization protein [Pseudomonadota bacterium]